MEFFPPPPEPREREEPDEPAPSPWQAAPEDMVAGVVPVELVLGRSGSAAVILTGIRAFPTGLAMILGVRVRGKARTRDLHAEIFDGPFDHDRSAEWERGRLKWGFEFSDGVRVTNVDGSGWDDWHEAFADGRPAPDWRPGRPLLVGGGGGGGSRSVDRDYWLWPLPPPGPLRVVCQWLDQDIELTVHDLDAGSFLDAAARAQPVWP
jgi:hypothetical protein